MKKSQNVTKTASIRGLEGTYVPTGTFGIDKTLFTTARNSNIETLYRVVKRSPEVLGCINAIIEDIMADGYEFVGSDSAKKNTKKFALKSKLFKILTNALFDLITTGNAYILKLSVSEDEVKELALELTTKMMKEFKVKKLRKQSDTVFELIDQTFKTPRDLQLLKSSTIRINFDETGKIKSFQQNVSLTQERVYRPEDIIHLSLINVGGEPYGFTPLEPLLNDIATLIFAKEYAGKFFENDGMPSFIMNLPNDFPDSPNYKKLKDELKLLREKANKFRGLLTTGEVNTTILEKFSKDMQFAELINHFTQIILIAMGVPSYRINYTVTSQKGSEVNRAYEGYYKKIGFLQKLIEEILNVELFEVFNTEIKFNRAYLIDEMREAQIAQTLSQIGAISIEEVRQRIGMPRELPVNDTMPFKKGDDNNIDFEEDKRNQTGENNNPKPADSQIDNKLKLFKEMNNVVQVDYDKFTNIVERFAETFQKAKILYRENKDFYNLFFNDGQWIYSTLLSKKGLDIEKFIIEKLRFAIKID